MNDLESSEMVQPIELTVAQYAAHFGKNENTVRTRLQRKKYRSIKKPDSEGRMTTYILVDPVQYHSVNHQEEPEIIHAQFTEAFTDDPQPFRTSHESSMSPSELLDFVRETFETMESYSKKLAELSRENGQYRAITDGRDRNEHKLESEIESLKNTLNEREQRIRFLEQLEWKNALMEEQLKQRVERITALESEIQDLKKAKRPLFPWGRKD